MASVLEDREKELREAAIALLRVLEKCESCAMPSGFEETEQRMHLAVTDSMLNASS